jgi:hypothetical protein
VLGFFLDSALTRPIAQASPKRFLSPTAGITKSSTVYLGDPYSSTITLAAAAGATTLDLDDVSEFLPSGQANVEGMTVSYTAISGLTLTGVTGVTATIPLSSTITPAKQWIAGSQVVVFPQGLDTSTLRISLGQNNVFGFPSMPLILGADASPILMGESYPIELQVMTPAGAVQEFTNWTVSTSAFYEQLAGSTDAVVPGTFGVTPSMFGYVNRQDQPLPQRLRLLPANRDISAPPAGFVIGQYAWRDDTEINAQAIVPTNWLTDPTTLGNQMFQAGIGQSDDLEPLGFTQENESIYLQIKRGFYFTGPLGYYLPGTSQLDFLSALNTTLQLSAAPQPTIPIFVGTYALDSQGFYEKSTEYRYKTAAAVAAGTNLPEYYYTLDRANNTITLNKPLEVSAVYLGTITGGATDYFDLPVYPVDNIESVYIARSGGAQLMGVNWTVDYDLGRVTISNPAGTGPSIAGAFVGEVVMAQISPAVAVLYETGTSDSRTIDTVDLNPAFAGISGGYVYLQHSRQEVARLVLSCDKPIIDIPATLSSIIGLVAYGPVYFDGDYALLQVTAYSEVPGQIVQGAVLQVDADPTTFTGTINYQDPTQETVTVTTGADGTANLIFRPSTNYGYWIPNTAAAGSLAGLAQTVMPNDTIVLPHSVPVSQLYSAGDTSPWLVTAYSVANNNPLLGMVDANPSQGEVPWATSGTPGTTTYKTNGERIPFISSLDILTPSQMLDANGRNYLDPQFNGNVVRLVYPQSLSVSSIYGAYFVSFLQRTMLRLQVVGSDVASNYIMLQMAAPALIDDDVWLILNDSIHGILNKYRLGWTITNNS